MLKRVTGVAFACYTAISGAQPVFPSKPIRMISLSAPGSGGDGLARLLAQHMGRSLKGDIVVENKPGAGGVLGMEVLKYSAPDGYTIGLGSYSAVTLIPSMNKKIRYDPNKDFVPIGIVGTAQTALIATPDFPASNLVELLGLARSSKQEIQYSTWGNGSSGHYCGALLNNAAKIQLEHVPYKSVAQIQTDLMGGHIKLAFVDMGTGIKMVKNGKAKAIGSCIQATEHLPNVQGYVDAKLDIGVKTPPLPRYALYAPTGTPRAVMDRLAQALKSTIDRPDVRNWMLEQGLTPLFTPSDELARMNRDDLVFWSNVAKIADIKSD